MEKRVFWIIFLGLFSILNVACTKAPEQIVVPVSGKQMQDLRDSREARLAELKREFPDLPQTTLDAFDSVPRMLFVADLARHRAYEDQMLPIGSEQATLKLSDIAWLVSQLKISPSDTVLEIGTGTGYMTAILARTAKFVYSIEINEYLGENARLSLERLNVSNVKLKNGNGLNGWKNMAPFDVIIVTAAVDEVPLALAAQLSENGRLAAPIIKVVDEDKGTIKTPWHVYQLKDDVNLVEYATRNSNITLAVTE